MRRRKVLISSGDVGRFSVRLRIAIDTFGVGTRIELPVSLPSSSGRALATAFAAPVSVRTMLSAAERPRRSPLWKLSMRFWSFVNECTVSTWPPTMPYSSLTALSTGTIAFVVHDAAERMVSSPPRRG